MPLIETDGVAIDCETSGREDGPWLVFSNSLGTDLRMWDAQAERFGRSRRILRYDSRGHGRSSVPEGPYTIERLGRDALAVMDAHGIDKADFCGLSKGGMIGMWLAVNAPERIRRLALCNTAAHLPPRELWDARIKAVTTRGMEAVAPSILERWFTRDVLDTQPETVAKLRTMLVATPPRGYAGCCAAIRDMDQRATIRNIGCPTLVVAGARDPATPPFLAEEIAGAIAGAKLVVLEAAHLSNIEAPAAFDDALEGFLTA